jgi:hypothetical protein
MTARLRVCRCAAGWWTLRAHRKVKSSGLPLHHCDRCERGVEFWWFGAWVSIGFSCECTDLDARDGWLKA